MNARQRRKALRARGRRNVEFELWLDTHEREAPTRILIPGAEPIDATIRYRPGADEATLICDESTRWPPTPEARERALRAMERSPRLADRLKRLRQKIAQEQARAAYAGPSHGFEKRRPE